LAIAPGVRKIPPPITESDDEERGVEGVQAADEAVRLGGDGALAGTVLITRSSRSRDHGSARHAAGHHRIRPWSARHVLDVLVGLALRTAL